MNLLVCGLRIKQHSYKYIKHCNCISWQALIHQVPRGVLAWAVRAGTNSLATPDNLARWGVRVTQTYPRYTRAFVCLCIPRIVFKS